MEESKEKIRMLSRQTDKQVAGQALYLLTNRMTEPTRKSPVSPRDDL